MYIFVLKYHQSLYPCEYFSPYLEYSTLTFKGNDSKITNPVLPPPPPHTHTHTHILFRSIDEFKIRRKPPINELHSSAYCSCVRVLMSNVL